MSGHFWLDGIALAFSFFNTILLVWLGLTILLNAEKRTLGVWIAAEGLVIAAVFFVSHSVLLGEGVLTRPQGLDFWWHAGWWPIVLSPLAWYLLMLWFTGFGDSPQNSLFKRHLPWLVGILLFTLLMAALILYGNPLPVFDLDAHLDFNTLLSYKGIPLLMIGYPLYIITCISLALDAVLHPVADSRLMGDQARQRSRPWLVATSLALLVVSLLVGWVMLWAVRSVNAQETAYQAYSALAQGLAWYDLGIELLVTAATLMLGQAVVSYEIFTGHVLPRRGFNGQWRSVLLLAGGVSLVTALCLDSHLNVIYTVLFTLLVMAVFFALLSWRTHVEREEAMHQLRPFVTSQRLYDRLLAPASPQAGEVDLALPFAALCRDVLATRQAVLLPLGPFAVLAGGPLAFPAGQSYPLPELSPLIAQMDSPHKMLPLTEAEWNGFSWAVSLWSERGLVGLLLVGPRRDGGLYVEEEMEIARASGERLLDIQAGAEMARRLVDWQRQRMAESQLLDRQTRRVLHDDVLPQLHAALLTLSSMEGAQTPAGQEVAGQLMGVHRQIADLLHSIPTGGAQEVARLGLMGALHQVVAGELDAACDSVDWQIEPGLEARLEALSPLAVELTYYAGREVIRNAARHARPAHSPRPLHLTLRAEWQAGLVLSIEDDGVGVDLTAEGQPVAEQGEAASLTSGHGLALHSAMLAVVGGSLALTSVPGKGTRVTLQVPAHP